MFENHLELHLYFLYAERQGPGSTNERYTFVRDPFLKYKRLTYHDWSTSRTRVSYWRLLYRFISIDRF